MGAVCQIDIHNKRETKLSRIARFLKKGYHRQLRYMPITEESQGGHIAKRYTGGWMSK